MKKTKILLELRPAFWEGFAGIPQETRLLFSMLKKENSLHTNGFLQPNLSYYTKFSIIKKRESHNVYYKTSNLILRLLANEEKNFFNFVKNFFLRRLGVVFNILIRSFFYINTTKLQLNLFKEFLWEKSFSQTLNPNLLSLITSGRIEYCSHGWRGFHDLLIYTKGLITPKLKLSSDIFISQTPYPAIIHKQTIHIVRYHDAIPIFLPQTISDSLQHQMQHMNALKTNVNHGSWFSCVSEASRNDLIKIFPKVKERSVTIYNTVSDIFFNENSNKNITKNIIRKNLHEGDKGRNILIGPSFLSNKEKELFYKKNIFDAEYDYILAVGTIEPRKNYNRLISAWEKIRSNKNSNLKLIIVGGLGWDYKLFLKRIVPWIEKGELFLLSSVPNYELRALYKHAAACICPSIKEGFDFSGIEAMKSGGLVVSSEISVHTEIYKNASLYFNPFSTTDMSDNIIKALELSENLKKLQIEAGFEVSDLYTEEKILPCWKSLFEKVKSN
jgi:glycosyltransferase involved in cell wall biosynthesis